MAMLKARLENASAVRIFLLSDCGGPTLNKVYNESLTTRRMNGPIVSFVRKLLSSYQAGLEFSRKGDCRGTELTHFY
jgi:hypothetical protein